MSRPILLAMNVAPERLAKLRFVCMRLGIQARAVEPADFSQPLSALCGLTERQADLPAADAIFADEVLLLANFPGPLVNRLLTGIRQARLAPFALKAVLTPTNAAWDCVKLHEELSAERTALAAGGKRVHQEEENS